MIKFEKDLFDMIKNILFNRGKNDFQKKLDKDIKNIKSSKNLFIFADKTRNIYEVNKETYNKLLTENITKTYKKASSEAYENINNEAKKIATKLKIDDRAECLAKKNSFITLKDHKENFENSPKCRLLNPARCELGSVSKQITEHINSCIKDKINVNQWKNTSSVIQWFKNIENKSQYTFIQFDIVDFYPSISKDILQKAIEFGKKFTKISKQDIEILMHCKQSLLFDRNTAWMKKDGDGTFDITMGSYDGAETCELVGLYILDILGKKFGKQNLGLYRDDGLAEFKNTTGRQSDKIRKDITKIFKDVGFDITIQANLKIVNFLDVTFDLQNGTYKPYKKPNDSPLYINSKSSNYRKR